MHPPWIYIPSPNVNNLLITWPCIERVLHAKVLHVRISWQFSQCRMLFNMRKLSLSEGVGICTRFGSGQMVDQEFRFRVWTPELIFLMKRSIVTVEWRWSPTLHHVPGIYLCINPLCCLSLLLIQFNKYLLGATMCQLLASPSSLCVLWHSHCLSGSPSLH